MFGWACLLSLHVHDVGGAANVLEQLLFQDDCAAKESSSIRKKAHIKCQLRVLLYLYDALHMDYTYINAHF